MTPEQVAYKMMTEKLDSDSTRTELSEYIGAYINRGGNVIVYEREAQRAVSMTPKELENVMKWFKGEKTND